MTKQDEAEIRTLIERWARAVHAGDLDGVLADHTADIVMFDVPPPYEGARGLAAYRDTWPGFLEWQRRGTVFDIESLDITAGDDVAFAHALLRCGTERDFAADPALRLRLTLGLRKEGGRWMVAHEHHSFPDRTASSGEGDEEEVRALHVRWSAATAAKDLDALMAEIADDVISYEHEQPLQYVGVDSVREVCARGLEAPGVTWEVPDLRVVAHGDLAVAWGLNHIRAQGQREDTLSRGTRVFQRRDGKWLLIHQHVSFPV